MKMFKIVLLNGMVFNCLNPTNRPLSDEYYKEVAEQAANEYGQKNIDYIVFE